MTLRRRPPQNRPGFSLVELLTVIAIIALLMSIVMPTARHARDLARKRATNATIHALETSLNMFHAAFNRYPDSSYRDDPLQAFYAGAPEHTLTGAHWLARALSGHDFNGVDAGGHVLGNVLIPNDAAGQSAIAQRKARYFDDDRVIIADNNSEVFSTDALFNPPNTGRLLIVDAFKYPILYYRAKPRAAELNLPAFVVQAGKGPVYNQMDNAPITGIAGNNDYPGWDFARTKFRHGLAVFGDPSPSKIDEVIAGQAAWKDGTQTFVGYLHSHDAHEGTGGSVVKAVKESSYVLISAGSDGLYGTEDDVTNFD